MDIRIVIGTPPYYSLDIKNPEPFNPISRNTVAFKIIDPETGIPENEGHDFNFEWEDNNGNLKIDIDDVFTISNNEGLDSEDWQMIIYQRYADIMLYDSGLIKL